jgi:hypothetical protein
MKLVATLFNNSIKKWSEVKHMVDPNQLPPQWQQWWLEQQAAEETASPDDDPDAVFDEETPPVMREEDPDIEAKLDQMFGTQSRPQ